MIMHKGDKMYQVIGCNKNKDDYIDYGIYHNKHDVEERVKELEYFLVRDGLRTEYGNLVDKIEVYHNDEFFCGSYK